MSYANIESRVESALATAISAAIAASPTLTGYGAVVRTYWTDGGADLTLPLIGIQASPNVPAGYRSAKRAVPFAVTIATAQPDDRNKQIAVALYDCVREILDTATISHADLTAIAIAIDSGGDVVADPDANIITVQATAQIDATLVATTTTTTTT